MLVFILEAFSEDIVSEYEVLKNELYKYNPDMEYKKRIICINKTDAIDEDKRKELEDLVFEDSIKPMLISAVSHLNIENLKNRIWNLLTPTD